MDTAPKNLPPDCGQLNKSGLLQAKCCLNSHFRGKKGILEVYLKMQTHFKRWSTNMTHNIPVSSDSADLGWNDKDTFTLVLMPGIMMDTRADEACNTPPNNSPVSTIIHRWPCFTELLSNHFQTFRQQLKGWKVQLRHSFVYIKMS